MLVVVDRKVDHCSDPNKYHVYSSFFLSRVPSLVCMFDVIVFPAMSFLFVLRYAVSDTLSQVGMIYPVCDARCAFLSEQDILLYISVLSVFPAR